MIDTCPMIITQTVLLIDRVLPYLGIVVKEIGIRLCPLQWILLQVE